MKIEVCMHCYNYEHRMNWMLCSLLQQEGDTPEILASISYMKNHGDPTTESLCDFFEKEGLPVKRLPYDTVEQIKNRSLARNQQLKDSDADWILFADADMLYDKTFFADLKKQLEGPLKDAQKCLTANRISLSIPFCTRFFNDDPRKYPCIIPEISDYIATWPVYRVTGKGIGPGNFQLANVKVAKEKGGIYSHRQRDVWTRTKGDRHFRINMGGIQGIETKPMYHLNHGRGNPEEQR